MSCYQKSNFLELIDADCAWDLVDTLFQPLLNDPKCTNDNWFVSVTVPIFHALAIQPLSLDT